MGSFRVATGEVSLWCGSCLEEELLDGLDWLIGVDVVEVFLRVFDYWLDLHDAREKLLLSLGGNRR